MKYEYELEQLGWGGRWVLHWPQVSISRLFGVQCMVGQVVIWAPKLMETETTLMTKNQ